MSNPIHGVAVSPASGRSSDGTSELLQHLVMQTQERQEERKEDREERKANRAEVHATVTQAAHLLAGLFTMLREEKKASEKRDRKDRRRREEKEAQREAGRLAAKAALSQCELVDEIAELRDRIGGYESDIAGMSTMLKQYREAEEGPKPEGQAPKPMTVRPMKGFKVRRPYGSAAASVPAAEESKENYW